MPELTVSERLRRLIPDYARVGQYGSVLSVILWEACGGDSPGGEETTKLPTIPEFVYCELSSALYEFLQGFPPHDWNYGSYSLNPNTAKNEGFFERKLWEELCVVLHDHRAKLDPSLWEIVVELLMAQFGFDGENRPKYSTWLEVSFRSPSVCDVTMRSTYMPSLAMKKVVADFLKTLQPHVAEQLKAIGALMKKYIVADVDHIREHYQW